MFSSAKHGWWQILPWGVLWGRIQIMQVKYWVWCLTYAKFSLHVAIIVSILGWCAKVTQRKRWVIKNDNMKPILLLSDLLCAISKMHLIFFFLQKCFTKRRTLVPITPPHKQFISPGRSIFSWQCLLLTGICIPRDLPNFNETLDQHHKSYFRLFWFLDKNSVVMALFGLYLENFCYWFPGPNSYVLPVQVWNGYFFKYIIKGLKIQEAALWSVTTIH